MSWPQNEGAFLIDRLNLQSGVVLPNATIRWKTHGTLSKLRDNVIVYPTSYSAAAVDLEWLIGPEGIFDPARWFIIIPNMFGNGVSSSPSNTPDYPDLVTTYDNVQAQRRLLFEQFSIETVKCVYGWSMGAQQAYHWAALFPDAVERIVVNCGSARTAVHNQVFLAGLLSVLESAAEHLGRGRFSSPPLAALKAFSRIYAGWALSQDFYRAGLHLTVSQTPDLETYLRSNWEKRFCSLDAANLYAQLRTWFFSDISDNPEYSGDLPRALAAIRAHVLLMPGATDLYFRVADNEGELRFLRSAELCPIPSMWGHRAGNPSQNPADVSFIRTQVTKFLDRS
jgi:homoserine O-acetyltransferase